MSVLPPDALNWTLGTTLRSNNQPAPAPVIYITGETLLNADDVTQLGNLLAGSVHKGRMANFRHYTKKVNLDFPANGALDKKAKDVKLRDMLFNHAELNIGGALAKDITYVFIMPDDTPEERDPFKKCCKIFADRRGSTLLYLHLETIIIGDLESLTISFYALGPKLVKIDLLLHPDDPWDVTSRKIHDTLCGLVSVKERTHLIKGDFVPFRMDTRPEAGRRMTIAQICNSEITEAVQFLCLMESWPVWDPEEGVLTMRVCDRTASASIVFKNVDVHAIDMTFIFTLQPGAARQFSCRVMRSPRPSNRRLASSIAEMSRSVVSSPKGFFKTACASIAQKFRIFGKPSEQQLNTTYPEGHDMPYNDLRWWAIVI